MALVSEHGEGCEADGYWCERLYNTSCHLHSQRYLLELPMGRGIEKSKENHRIIES